MNTFLKPYYFLLITLLLLAFSCEEDDPINTINLGNDDTVLITTRITEDTVWENLIDDPNVADYRVTIPTWRIEAGLTIQPGVVVEFDAGGSMEVFYDNGYLIANGTVAQPITFTGTAKTAGFWNGILFNSEDTRNSLNHCIVEYGGGGELRPDITFANISAIDYAGRAGKLNITNTVVQHSAGYGLVIDRGDTQLLNFANNTFSNNVEAGVLISSNNVAKLDNASNYTSSNGYNGVEILGGVFEQPISKQWNNLGGVATYKLLSDLRIESGLTLSANTTIEFDAGSMLEINYDDGYLTAIGTATQPIIFRGEVNTPGFWKGILFKSEDTRNEMRYCNVSDAGGGELEYLIEHANIGVVDFAGRVGQLKLSNCTISNSAACGIAYNTGAQLTQSNNTFVNIAASNICD